MHVCESCLTDVLQVQHWLDDAKSSSVQVEDAAAAEAAAPHRPTLELTIDSQDQLPAAEAVVAALYGAHDTLLKLDQQQQLAAALIADRVHIAPAVKHSVQALLSAAKSEEGLSAAALEALASLYPWPSCLLPLLPAAVAGAACCKGDAAADLDAIRALDSNRRVQRMLLAVLGDLDAAWRDDQLRQLLLKLPLPAMQLLLASDQLRVGSEDIVLYTARQYVAGLGEDTEAKETAFTALAPLVRCPHLSGFAMKWLTLAAESHQLLLGRYVHQLRQLLSVRCAGEAAAAAAQASLSADSAAAGEATADGGVANSSSSCSMPEIEFAPESWRLRQRQIKPLDGGSKMHWRLPVSLLQQACVQAVALHQMHYIESPESASYGGLGWQMRLLCEPQDSGNSVLIGAYAEMDCQLTGLFYKLEVSLICHSTSGGSIRHELLTPWLNVAVGYGDDDVFGVGPMAGGWDDAAWVAKGLPTAGELEFELIVHNAW